MRGQIIKKHLRKDGYVTVSLCKKAKHISLKVHRLVAEAFLKNPQNKEHVNHINFNKSDNRVENLEWVTCAENAAWNATHSRGKNKTNKPFMAINLNSGEVRFYKNSLLAVEDGFDRAAIWRCMKGEYSHHHGYVFKYIEPDTPLYLSCREAETFIR